MHPNWLLKCNFAITFRYLILSISIINILFNRVRLTNINLNQTCDPREFVHATTMYWNVLLTVYCTFLRKYNTYIVELTIEISLYDNLKFVIFNQQIQNSLDPSLESDITFFARYNGIIASFLPDENYSHPTRSLKRRVATRYLPILVPVNIFPS